MSRMTLIDKLNTYFEPIAKDIGSKPGFRASHCLGLWLVLQINAVAYAPNDGIKLITIVEHVVGH